jgi:uncharacterized membrane protein YtjA (UPF0391 family)
MLYLIAPPGWIAMLETGCIRVRNYLSEEANMLYWAAVFFVIALIAALLGFAGVATAAAGAAKILFYIFLVVFLVTLIMGLGRRGTRV